MSPHTATPHLQTSLKMLPFACYFLLDLLRLAIGIFSLEVCGIGFPAAILACCRTRGDAMSGSFTTGWFAILVILKYGWGIIPAFGRQSNSCAAFGGPALRQARGPRAVSRKSGRDRELTFLNFHTCPTLVA